MQLSSHYEIVDHCDKSLSRGPNLPIAVGDFSRLLSLSECWSNTKPVAFSRSLVHTSVAALLPYSVL